jgi:Flp pilus assembly pilin Flp
MGKTMRYLRNIIRTTASSTLIEYGLIGSFLAIAGVSACIAVGEDKSASIVAFASGL